ncbi:MAG TPA: tetraacyldisaccharide 4'-kinase [Bacteroidota bacterium]|nr:tetraacyldisaccharide 4'-kinase [Bacteroidota bacterium]
MKIRLLLLPFSWVYWCIITLRNWFFDKELIRRSRFPVFIISVGNISLGGVGKTPIVEMFLERLLPFCRVGVVSRGYRRKSKGTVVVSSGNGICTDVLLSGDEPAQLALKYPSAIIVVDEKRARGVAKAIEIGASLILLDDAFQHRYVERDLDIVVIPADDIIHKDYLLPAGNRREPLSALRRCSMLIISNCRNKEQFSQAEVLLKEFNKPCIGVSTVPKAILEFGTRKECDPLSIKGRRCVLLSGIGSAEKFEATAKLYDINIVGHIRFRDHHWYSEKDIAKLFLFVQRVNAEIILTTEKDAVRLQSTKSITQDSVPVYVVQIQQNIIAGIGIFEELVQNIRIRKSTL